MERSPRRRRRSRRVALVLLLALICLGGVALAMASAGGYDVYPRSRLLTAAQRRGAPAWTRPCWKDAPSMPDRPVCARAQGRVVWVQQHDDDGDGDRHLLVVAHRRVRIVKVQRRLPVDHLPGIGTRIDAVGMVMKGASGHDEIDAVRLVPGGPSG